MNSTWCIVTGILNKPAHVKGYLSHRQTAKAQVSEFTHTI